MWTMVFLLTTTFLIAAEGDSWQHDIQKASEQAKKEDKAIMLYFSGSDWCKPCIMLKKEVMNTEAFQNYAKDKLVLVELDFPRMKKNRLSSEQTNHNESLAEKYNKEGSFPMVVFINSDGKVLGKTGFRPGGSQAFIDYTDKILH